MKRFLLTIALLVWFALVTALPPTALAQPANPGPPEKKAAAKPAPAKKPSAGPFNGKLAAVSLEAKTIQVGKRTFQITPETKLYKGGKPAGLPDAVVGENVSGYVKPTEEGKWLATTVNLGPKPGKDKSKSESKPGTGKAGQ